LPDLRPLTLRHTRTPRHHSRKHEHEHQQPDQKGQVPSRRLELAQETVDHACAGVIVMRAAAHPGTGRPAVIAMRRLRKAYDRTIHVLPTAPVKGRGARSVRNSVMRPPHPGTHTVLSTLPRDPRPPEGAAEE